MICLCVCVVWNVYIYSVRPLQIMCWVCVRVLCTLQALNLITEWSILIVQHVYATNLPHWQNWIFAGKRTSKTSRAPSVLPPQKLLLILTYYINSRWVAINFSHPCLSNCSTPKRTNTCDFHSINGRNSMEFIRKMHAIVEIIAPGEINRMTLRNKAANCWLSSSTSRIHTHTHPIGFY